MDGIPEGTTIVELQRLRVQITGEAIDQLKEHLRATYAKFLARGSVNLSVNGEGLAWTRGLYEGVIAADLISKQRMEERNRISLIVLDSTLEIAFKEYLVNESGTSYSDAKLLTLFSKRQDVHNEIKKYATFSGDEWKKINYYYRLRCKLVHEKATAGISDQQLGDFRTVVEGVLERLYALKF